MQRAQALRRMRCCTVVVVAAAAGGGSQTWAPYVHGLVRLLVVVLPQHLNLLADERLVERRRQERVDVLHAVGNACLGLGLYGYG